MADTFMDMLNNANQNYKPRSSYKNDSFKDLEKAQAKNIKEDKENRARRVDAPASKDNKPARITILIDPKMKNDFKIATALNYTSMSVVLMQFICEYIYDTHKKHAKDAEQKTQQGEQKTQQG